MSETFGSGEYVYRPVEGWAKWPEDWNLHDVAAVRDRASGEVHLVTHRSRYKTLFLN